MPLSPNLQQLLSQALKLSEHEAGEEQSSAGASRSSLGEIAHFASETRHLNLRQTLKTGQIHIRRPVRRHFNHSWLLIDAGPSMTQRFSREQLLELGDFFKAWGQRHHHFAHVVLAPANVTWGPELWSHWEQSLLGQPRGQIILLSDLHGPMPTGSFWSRIGSEAPLRLLQVLHPWPTFSEDTVLKNIQAEDHQHYLFQREAFESKRRQWQSQWKTEQRKTGFLWTQTSVENLFDLAQDLQKCVNHAQKSYLSR